MWLWSRFCARSRKGFRTVLSIGRCFLLSPVLVELENWDHLNGFIDFFSKGTDLLLLFNGGKGGSLGLDGNVVLPSKQVIFFARKSHRKERDQQFVGQRQQGEESRSNRTSNMSFSSEATGQKHQKNMYVTLSQAFVCFSPLNCRNSAILYGKP